MTDELGPIRAGIYGMAGNELPAMVLAQVFAAASRRDSCRISFALMATPGSAVPGPCTPHKSPVMSLRSSWRG